LKAISMEGREWGIGNGEGNIQPPTHPAFDSPIPDSQFPIPGSNHFFTNFNVIRSLSPIA
jgi:hypothetical protein